VPSIISEYYESKASRTLEIPRNWDRLRQAARRQTLRLRDDLATLRSTC
jgi:hypothetical protein